MLLNLGRALKPRDLQKEIDELKQSTKETKEKVDRNKVVLKQLIELDNRRQMAYSIGDYDSNLN